MKTHYRLTATALALLATVSLASAAGRLTVEIGGLDQSGHFADQAAFCPPDANGPKDVSLINKPGTTIPDDLAALQKIEPLLTENGGSLSQGALSWILAASDRAIPIPGFTASAQIHANFGAVTHGKLPVEIMERLRQIVSRGADA